MKTPLFISALAVTSVLGAADFTDCFSTTNSAAVSATKASHYYKLFDFETSNLYIDKAIASLDQAKDSCPAWDKPWIERAITQLKSYRKDVSQPSDVFASTETTLQNKEI